MSSGASKIDLRHADSKVVFSFTKITLDKKYSFYSLSKEEATQLLNRLRYIEKMNWKQLGGLDNSKGLTPEKKGSKSYQLINDANMSEKKIVEQYYFHFRVKQKELFRVFGYQDGQFFCITHLDTKGTIHKRCH